MVSSCGAALMFILPFLEETPDSCLQCESIELASYCNSCGYSSYETWPSLLLYLKQIAFFLHAALSKDASEHQKGEYILIQNVEEGQLGLFDQPLPCFGCGIGWFS